MDLRDLLNKLDNISEELDLTDFETQRKLSNAGELSAKAPTASLGWDSNDEQDAAASATMKTTSARVQFNKIQQHLYDLLKQLRAQGNVKEAAIAEELLESFGYDLNEMDMAKLSNWAKNNGASSIAKDAGKSGFLSSLGKKIAWPVTAATAIWDAYERITALPTNMPREQFKKEVATIIGKVAGEYGLFAVGAGIGAAIGGAITGPGGLVSGLAGGLIAEYTFGDDVDKFVDWVVEKIYSGTPTSQTTSTSNGQQPSADSEPTSTETITVAKEIQTKLETAGFSVGQHGIDGKIGPDTYNALQQYKKKVNAKNDAEAIAQLLGIPNAEAPATSQVQEMSRLKDTLDQLDEGILSTALKALKGVGGGVGRFMKNNKFLSAIAAFGVGGYVWDQYGNAISSKVQQLMPSTDTSKSPTPSTDTTQPTGAGATSTPATPSASPQVNQNLKMIVSSIKADIKELQRITNLEVKADAEKAIKHAQDTLNIYAPGI